MFVVVAIVVVVVVVAAAGVVVFIFVVAAAAVVVFIFAVVVVVAAAAVVVFIFAVVVVVVVAAPISQQTKQQKPFLMKICVKADPDESIIPSLVDADSGKTPVHRNSRTQVIEGSSPSSVAESRKDEIQQRGH